MYTCSICAKSYDSIEEYTKCVNECAKKVKIEQEKIKKEKLDKEKEIRKKELRGLEELYSEKVAEFVKDYGFYTPSLGSSIVHNWFQNPFDILLTSNVVHM